MIRFIFTLFVLTTSAFASGIQTKIIPFENGGKVEFLWKVPEGTGPFPVFMIVHGHQGNKEGAVSISRHGALDLLADRGMIAVVASQSGYGRTNGKPDHAGKNSQAAIKSVIQYFRQFPQADQKKFILYGTSMGATLAAMIATQDTDLAAVILENGIYDVQAGMTNLWFRSQSDKKLSTLYESLDEETKGAYAERSAILHPEKIKATVLLMAGMGDKVALPDQTIKFHEAIRKAGGRSEMYLFPFAGHSIPEYMKGPAMSQLLHSIKPK